MVFTKNFAKKTIRILMLGLVFLLGINSTSLADNYTVKPGDTLFLIGQKFGLTVEQLQSANDLEGTLIFPRQILNIPCKSTYTVRPGDTLFSIGQKFGISVEQLLSLNELEETWIFPRQVLNIPSYVVRSGDTLYSIARNNSITWQQLKNHNNLQSTKIIPGQTLIIPTNNLAAGYTATTSSYSATRHNFTQEELTLLARTVYSEARGEPYKGQVAVAAVVLNRLGDPDFPDTIEEVIFQPLAFTAVADGQFWLTPNQKAYDAVHDAINGWDPVDGALYYWNPVTATSRWIWTRDITHQIGRHVFGI